MDMVSVGLVSVFRYIPVFLVLLVPYTDILKWHLPPATLEQETEKPQPCLQWWQFDNVTMRNNSNILPCCQLVLVPCLYPLPPTSCTSCRQHLFPLHYKRFYT